MANNETAKSGTIELSINPDYVQNWGTWEAIREIIQNALDADDAGCPMSIERGSGMKKTIYVRNEGTTLSRSALLLGATSKDGGGFRGKFGEGLKLALLVLTRHGIDVQVRTGKEMWSPFLETSETFGAKVLKVKVTPATTFENKVEVKIHGLTDGSWDTIQGLLLDVAGLPATKVKSGECIDVPVSAGTARILTAERFKNKLFVRGLFVGKLPDQYVYGYDLPGVQLDRDRKMADQWSLRDTLAGTLAAAISGGKLTGTALLDLLGQDCGEATAVAARYEMDWTASDELSRQVTKAFEEKHGEDAIPVDSMAESLEAGHHSMQGKMVHKAIKKLVEKEKGTFEKRKKSRGLDAKALVGAEEMTDEEQDNLLWAAHLTSFCEPTFSLDKLQVVEFYSPTIDGSYHKDSGQIRVARKLLTDRRELLATLVHETAHAWGDDGSVGHERKIERMLCEIVVRLSGKG